MNESVLNNITDYHCCGGYHNKEWRMHMRGMARIGNECDASERIGDCTLNSHGDLGNEQDDETFETSDGYNRCCYYVL